MEKPASPFEKIKRKFTLNNIGLTLGNVMMGLMGLLALLYLFF